MTRRWVSLHEEVLPFSGLRKNRTRQGRAQSPPKITVDSRNFDDSLGETYWTETIQFDWHEIFLFWIPRLLFRRCRKLWIGQLFSLSFRYSDSFLCHSLISKATRKFPYFWVQIEVVTSLQRKAENWVFAIHVPLTLKFWQYQSWKCRARSVRQ